MEQLISIGKFILESFIHIWPYLLITIPLAVLANISGFSVLINKAISGKPIISILLATAVGALSPFCSCGVIPVISSLLIGGVPLAPVMSFWIASPSMDPEIYFLSASSLGWQLASWRLVATFIISLSAGYITYYATLKGFITKNVLRVSSTGPLTCNCTEVEKDYMKLTLPDLLREVLKATKMISKFMFMAFLITALIRFYIPSGFLKIILKEGGTSQVILATITGIPLYTSNITALPLVGGLLSLGLNKGAALAFLIAGSTTTLPAMVAVWGITKRRVFFLYILFSLLGALLSGLIFNLVTG